MFCTAPLLLIRKVVLLIFVWNMLIIQLHLLKEPDLYKIQQNPGSVNPGDYAGVHMQPLYLLCIMLKTLENLN